MKPNFIICGTQKGGTRALLQFLKQHPDIYMHPDEINFFSWHYNKGNKWYESHFDKNVFVGEKSPSYMLIPEAAERIYQYAPNMKLIFCLRNPVDRAYSHYWMNVRRGKETRSFSEAIREKERVNKYGVNMYLSRGVYDEKIARFRKYFNDSQLLILRSERMREHPKNVLKDVQDFLGFTDFIFDTSIQTKKGTKPRNECITRLLQNKWIRNTPVIGEYLQLFNNKSDPYPRMKQEDKVFLEEYYESKM